MGLPFVGGAVGYLGYDIHYFELPHRDDNQPDHSELKQFLAGQYRHICTELESVTGVEFDKNRFFSTVEKVNKLRLYISEIKQYMRESERNPMGGLELLLAEFGALSYYGDLDECTSVLDDLRRTVKSRAEEGSGYNGQPLRLIWVTPPADPLLINYIEELGGRIVGSEYLINQTTPMIAEEGDPFEILAEAHLNGSLMGSTQFRTELILKQVELSEAEGAVVSGIFGSSHCPYETVPIIEALREKGVPTLAFDVVAPGKIRLQSQVYNRMEAFMESLMARRSRRDK